MTVGIIVGSVKTRTENIRHANLQVSTANSRNLSVETKPESNLRFFLNKTKILVFSKGKQRSKWHLWFCFKTKFRNDGAIAQAVSRWLPTSAAQVRAQVRTCGICGGPSGTVPGFLRVLRFPLPILIPPTAPHSSSIIQGCTIGQLVADVPSGFSLTPPKETNKKNRNTLWG
jgi:hypothetical protein